MDNDYRSNGFRAVNIYKLKLWSQTFHPDQSSPHANARKPNMHSHVNSCLLDPSSKTKKEGGYGRYLHYGWGQFPRARHTGIYVIFLKPNIFAAFEPRIMFFSSFVRCWQFFMMLTSYCMLLPSTTG